MALDDAIRRAQAKADKDDKVRQAEEDFQAIHVPRGVQLLQSMLHDAAHVFQDAEVPPVHVLCQLVGQDRMFDRVRPAAVRYERLACGWRIRNWLLGVDGTLYDFSGKAHHVVIRSIKEAKRAAQPTSGRSPWEVQVARGALRLGLVPGDTAIFVRRDSGKAGLRPVDLQARMSASEREPRPEEHSVGITFDDHPSRDFVVSPSGMIFVESMGWDSKLYDPLEDVLGAEIVTQQGYVLARRRSAGGPGSEAEV